MRYNGVPCQRARDAIIACGETMMPERLEQAVRTALEQGYIMPREYREIRLSEDGGQ